METATPEAHWDASCAHDFGYFFRKKKGIVLFKNVFRGDLKNRLSITFQDDRQNIFSTHLHFLRLFFFAFLQVVHEVVHAQVWSQGSDLRPISGEKPPLSGLGPSGCLNHSLVS